ncbi:cytochrome c3 family protein [candidate division KSB1 bacterium]
MKKINQGSFYFLSMVGISICLAFGYTIPESNKARKELIKFSHQFHIEDMGFDCAACHESAETSALSSDNNLGHKPACETCHDGDTARDDCDVCHYDADEAVAFPNPVREFKFNHQSHLALVGDESCSKCHKGLESTDYAGPEHLPTMTSCVECHNNNTAPQYCEQCHTKVQSLQPATHTPN